MGWCTEVQLGEIENKVTWPLRSSTSTSCEPQFSIICAAFPKIYVRINCKNTVVLHCLNVTVSVQTFFYFKYGTSGCAIQKDLGLFGLTMISIGNVLPIENALTDFILRFLAFMAFVFRTVWQSSDWMMYLLRGNNLKGRPGLSILKTFFTWYSINESRNVFIPLQTYATFYTTFFSIYGNW